MYFNQMSKTHTLILKRTLLRENTYTQLRASVCQMQYTYILSSFIELHVDDHNNQIYIRPNVCRFLNVCSDTLCTPGTFILNVWAQNI